MEIFIKNQLVIRSYLDYVLISCSVRFQQALMDKYIRYPGYEKRPPLLDMLRNTSLTLMDYHFSVGYPEPLLPNAIPVGGLSAKIGAEIPQVSCSSKGFVDFYRYHKHSLTC